MKLTKELEKEIMQVYLGYWDAYVKGDSDKCISYIDECITIFGSTADEVFSNKHGVANFFASTAGEVAGKVDLRNRNINIVPLDEMVLVAEQLDLYILSGNEWAFYAKTRVSSLFKHQPGGWKLIHQHGSFPDHMVQEGESIAFESITKENLQLKEAVKRRTIELEQKNKELEIETALEKVRAEAMGMKKPDDILSICKVMFTELQLLGFSELRNTLINFWDDDSSSLIDYDYSHDTGGNKAKLSYSSHPVFEQFQQKIKNSKDAFAKLVVTSVRLISQLNIANNNYKCLI